MKQILPFILFLAIIGMASSCSSEQTENAEPVVTDTLPSLIMQIQKTSRLYTTEYHIHKIVTHDDVVRLKGNFLSKDFDIPLPLGERKVAKITLTSSKINQKEIKEYVGLTRSHFTDKELTNYEQQGRKSILDNVPNMGLIQTAQENATRVLVPMLTQMGYQEENITIAFRKNLSIQQLINSNIEKQ